eukprot:CAMPEP_0176488348 /NCGR_PEP_ID=MMETSP0200_2-20121128/6656_1 /TAXON_ID=947934 /ORGANISM="Chaetoceros sp., Strain GSL56" /LENGTH=510 /DNA_ID=CAMNT_0017885315 /DNA_START=269 /DNA_END=1801 /DNA_ORIENTATION=+
MHRFAIYQTSPKTKLINNFHHQFQCPQKTKANDTTERINFQTFALYHVATPPGQRRSVVLPLRDKCNRRVIRRVIRPHSPNKPAKQTKWPTLQKILTPQNIVPKPIEMPPNLKPLIHKASTAHKETQKKKTREKLKQWLKDNAGIIILNCGSIASFISFTRTDILELRLLSITGSLSSVVYVITRPPPIVVGPIIWSSVFAMTNSYMVYHIYEERKGKPRQLTSQEEDVYEEHFLPHAVTPRQYEKLLSIAKLRELQRGEVLIQKGQTVDKVYLVISGTTQAVTNLSRRVTAASSCKGNKERYAGGDAGAWVGELAFLDYLSERDRRGGILTSPPPVQDDIKNHVPVVIPLATAAAAVANSVLERRGDRQDDSSTSNTSTGTGTGTGSKPPRNNSVTKNSILTYIATEDSILYEWDFEELADLMKTSADMRSAVTRSMTAAVVGKVVNLYISKADADKPVWKKWLFDNWQSLTLVHDTNNNNHEESSSGISSSTGMKVHILEEEQRRRSS